MIFNVLRTFLTNKNRSACGNAMTGGLIFDPTPARLGAAFHLVITRVTLLIVGGLDETKGEASPMSP